MNLTSKEWHTHTHLSDECVIVDFDVDVDGGVGKCIKNVPEEGDAFVLSPLTETLCKDKDTFRHEQL